MTGLRPLFLVWLALTGLLASTIGASFLLTGPISLAVSIAIAAAKAALIFWFYMHLNEASGVVRLVAVGAVVWLVILFILTSADFATRSLF
jgi:cytochrome c oxidase subunit IV